MSDVLASCSPFVCLPVTGGFETRVDPDIAEALGSRKLWRKARYVGLWAAGRRMLLHHLVAGHPLAGDVDHINGDRFDNRRCNLRVVDRSHNMLNQHRRMLASSGFRGVHGYHSRWRPTLQWQGRLYRDISLREPVLAALARDDCVRRVTGLEDGLNFPYAMTRTEVAGLLRASALWELALWFVKRSDGSIRQIVCRADPGVPEQRRTRDEALALVTVTEVASGESRCIPLEGILCLRYQQRGYRVVDAFRAAA